MATGIYIYIYIYVYTYTYVYTYMYVYIYTHTAVKNLPASAGDQGSIPGLGRSPGEGNGNPLQYSCLGNPMDRGASQAAVHGVTKESDKT